MKPCDCQGLGHAPWCHRAPGEYRTSVQRETQHRGLWARLLAANLRDAAVEEMRVRAAVERVRDMWSLP